MRCFTILFVVLDDSKDEKIDYVCTCVFCYISLYFFLIAKIFIQKNDTEGKYIMT